MGDPHSWMVNKGKSYIILTWMMTGGTPMTQETSRLMGFSIVMLDESTIYHLVIWPSHGGSHASFRSTKHIHLLVYLTAGTLGNRNCETSQKGHLWVWNGCIPSHMVNWLRTMMILDSAICSISAILEERPYAESDLLPLEARSALFPKFFHHLPHRNGATV